MSTDTICRKNCPAQAEVVRKERIVRGYITTTDVDMIGDVVLPEGMDDQTYFAGTRSVNLEHDPNKPVGTNRNLARLPRGVYATTYIGRHALGEDVMTMIEDGVLRGHSIEWDPRTLESSPPTKEERAIYGEGCKRVFRRWVLTRYAFTAQPMNPHCLVDGVKSAAYIASMTPVWERMEELFTAGKIHRSSAVAAGFPDTPERKSWPVAETTRAKAVLVAAGGLVWRRKA